MSLSIRVASTSEVRPLRQLVLRAGMDSQNVDFEGDDEITTVHVAAIDSENQIVGVSTWLVRPFSSQPQVIALQLRGMATQVELQSRGIGALLLEAGEKYGATIGAQIVWANARDTALDFYHRNGYRTVGDGFIESVTQLPHHQVMKYLSD